MLVISAGPNAGHRPPFEVEGGELVPSQDVPDRVPALLSGLTDQRIEEVRTAEIADLMAVHDLGYVTFLREACAALTLARQGDREPVLYPSVFPYRPGLAGRSLKARMGQYCFDTYTPLLAGTFDAALRTASAALQAADRVLSGSERMAYAVGRPPGHHAERDRCGGYSYLNGTALAAHRLAAAGPVAVLDVDVHHGNGTQHLFYDRADVRTASIHGDPAELFPHFSGFADETGTGPGHGANRNFPLPTGTNDRAYQPALEAALEWLTGVRPAFLVVALGFDTHTADPIGGFGLSTEYFSRMAQTIQQLGVPTVLVQEGGYAVAHLGSCTGAFVRGWELGQTVARQ
jgi:acetoin utilization deacetylase AcuC-like enzyme